MEKPKKERTEAQKKATQSMLAKMKERREKGEKVGGRKKKEVKNTIEVELSSDSEPEHVPAPAPAPTPAPQKNNYLTKDDLHQFKNEIASLLQPPPPPVQEKEIKRKPRVKKLPEEHVEEEIYNPVVKQSKPQPKPSAPSALTGYDLLDRLLKK